jgi:hypothetical protein
LKVPSKEKAFAFWKNGVVITLMRLANIIVIIPTRMIISVLPLIFCSQVTLAFNFLINYNWIFFVAYVFSRRSYHTSRIHFVSLIIPSMLAILFS